MPEANRENLVNALLALTLLAAPLIAVALDEPFYVTLASRVAILALAGVGLNLALGTGGMVSFGHAAFFGLGGYVAGVAGLVAFILQDAGDQHTDVDFVVDDENLVTHVPQLFPRPAPCCPARPHHRPIRCRFLRRLRAREKPD